MGNKKTSMQDIANKLDISRVTVSKAFKGSPDISNETREKIFQVANELNYQYKTLSHVKVLLLTNYLFLELEEQFYTKVYKKLIKESSTKDISITMNVITEEMEDKLILPSINDSEYDGILLLGELPKSYIMKLETLNMPMVFIDFYNHEFNYDAIVTNNFMYSYEITSHLIDKGHTCIGFVGNIHSTSSVRDRYLGYYKALLENNLKLDNSYIIEDRNKKGLLKKFELPEKLPSAFVCNNDYTAYNLIDFLETQNYIVPDDFSVVGFDDVLDSNLKQHRLTTVRVNIDDIVILSIQRIIQTINKKSLKPKTYIVNSSIIIRDSVKELKNDNI